MSLKTDDNSLFDVSNVKKIEQQFIKKNNSTEYSLSINAAEAL